MTHQMAPRVCGIQGRWKFDFFRVGGTIGMQCGDLRMGERLEGACRFGYAGMGRQTLREPKLRIRVHRSSTTRKVCYLCTTCLERPRDAQLLQGCLNGIAFLFQGRRTGLHTKWTIYNILYAHPRWHPIPGLQTGCDRRISARRSKTFAPSIESVPLIR
jgi:hypothetical protein